MVHIKEVPLGETHTQPDSQAAAQGSQKTTTQTTRTQQAPRLHQRDPVLAILNEIKENIAAAQRQQTTIIENQIALNQQAKTCIQSTNKLIHRVDNLIQEADDLIQGWDHLAQMMDEVLHKADTVNEILQGTLDDISRG